MKKILITMALLLCFAQVAEAQANRGYISHTVSIVDLNGRPITDISEVYIYLPDTTTTQTIYLDRGLNDAITLPMTTTSTNTGLTQATGVIKWWGQDSYDFQLGNGEVTVSNAYSNNMTSNQGEIVFPYFLRTYDSQTLSDGQSIIFGGDSDWTANGGTIADLLTFTPKANGGVFQIGNSGGTLDADFRVYTASGVGLLIDEGADTFGITGLTTNINVSSDYATNINTGTSTGAVTIGNSAAGAFAVDTTSTAAINADTSVGITTTDGSGDITIDAIAGSVIVRGTEEASDAVVIHADGTAGGVTIDSGTGDITLTSTDDIVLTNATAVGDMIQLLNTAGTSVTEGSAAIQLTATAGGIIAQSAANLANAIQIRTDGGTTSSMLIHNDTGTSATDTSASIQITSDLGGIELTSALAAANQIRLNATGIVAGAGVVLETTDGGITLNADGGTNGDITIDAASELSLITAGVGILAKTATYEHKIKYYPISAGVVTASEIIVGGGQGLVCVGLASGASEIGSTEGYASSDTETDFIRYMIEVPDDFVDTGTAADFIVEFDIKEEASEECNIDIRIFEYDAAANTTAIQTDALVVADSAARGWAGLVTGAAGIGDEADLQAGDHLIFEVTGTAGGDDFFLYGMRLTYRVGLMATN